MFQFVFQYALRDLILTNKALYLIGREKSKKHNLWSSSDYIEVVKRKIEFDLIADITVSSLQVILCLLISCILDIVVSFFFHVPIP